MQNCHARSCHSASVKAHTSASVARGRLPVEVIGIDRPNVRAERSLLRMLRCISGFHIKVVANTRFGSSERKLHLRNDALRRQGMLINHKRIVRIMQEDTCWECSCGRW